MEYAADLVFSISANHLFGDDHNSGNYLFYSYDFYIWNTFLLVVAEEAKM